MSTAVVLDWDGVVFDDDRFKETLFSRLSEDHNITKHQLETAYQKSKDTNGYNDRRLAEFLADKYDLHTSALLTSIDAVMRQTEAKFIYADIHNFIKDALPHVSLMILTAGDERIQAEKIRHSNLRSAFVEVVTVSAGETAINKASVLNSLLQNYEKVYFFDDKPSTILHLHETFRDEHRIIPILVDRASLYSSSPDTFVAQLLSYSSLIDSGLLHRPRTLISAVRIKNQDAVFMVQEGSGAAKGLWTIPLGHVEPDELLLESALREVYEETGLRVSIDVFYRLVTVDGKDYLGGEQDNTRSIIIACFDATIIDNNPSTTPELTSMWVADYASTRLRLRGNWQSKLF